MSIKMNLRKQAIDAYKQDEQNKLTTKLTHEIKVGKFVLKAIRKELKMPEHEFEAIVKIKIKPTGVRGVDRVFIKFSGAAQISVGVRTGLFRMEFVQLNGVKFLVGTYNDGGWDYDWNDGFVNFLPALGLAYSKVSQVYHPHLDHEN